MHDVLLHEVTLVFAAALFAGLVLMRLRQPALVGFVVVGVVLGPGGLAIIDATENLRFLAELGVTLLMFVIGMELSLRAFRRVYKLAISVVVCQMLGIGLALYLLGLVVDWQLERVIALSFALTLSSTAVGMKVLEDSGELRTHAGQVAVAVLIAQDLMAAPMLITIDGLGSGAPIVQSILPKLVGAIIILVGLIWFLSRKERIHLPFMAWITDHSGTVSLAALTLCFGLGTLAELGGMSVAFGAFLAGLILGNSADRGRFLQSILPIQEILMMLFFLSVGLLIDVGFLLQNLTLILVLSALVLVGKTGLSFVILKLFRVPSGDAAVGSAALGSAGEFSFVIGASALAAGLIQTEGSKLLVSVIFVSLLATPIWLSVARKSSARWQRALADEK